MEQTVDARYVDDRVSVSIPSDRHAMVTPLDVRLYYSGCELGKGGLRVELTKSTRTVTNRSTENQNGLFIFSFYRQTDKTRRNL